MNGPRGRWPRAARRMDPGGVFMTSAWASRAIDRGRALGASIARVVSLASEGGDALTLHVCDTLLRFLNMTKKSAKSTGKARQGVSLFLINYRRNSVAFAPYAVQAEISVHPS